MTSATQGSAEWLRERLGCVTASRMADVGKRPYMLQLVAERLTGRATETYVTAAMQRGIDLEPEARALYSLLCDEAVSLTGFVPHPSISWTGASPDGLVGKNGLVEIKCLSSDKHVDLMLGGEIQAAHQLQMLWQMECTGRDWVDYVSYDPRFSREQAIFVTRFERDDERMSGLRERVVDFLNEIDRAVQEIMSRS